MLFRVRVWLLLARLWVLYRWRRESLSVRVPYEVELFHQHDPMPDIDTGGTYRPQFGSQFADPTESHTGDHSEGHNCTCAGGGMALDFHTGGKTVKRGGSIRHAQSDQSGGTDLYDIAEAWAKFGEALSIRSGQGWPKVIACLDAGRGVILQGDGGLRGCGDYKGPHAIYVNPEKHSDGRWLTGDPECTKFQWTEPRDLEAFAERLNSSVYFAVTRARVAAPRPPEPPVPPKPPEPPQTVVCPDVGPELARQVEYATSAALDAQVNIWVDWLAAGKPQEGDQWGKGEWGGKPVSDVRDLDPVIDAGWCDEATHWARGPLPDPVASAYTALNTPSQWNAGAWRALLWS